VHDIEEMLASLDAASTPKADSGATRELTGRRNVIAQYGCPHGTLCSELEKRTSGTDTPPSDSWRFPIEWTSASSAWADTTRTT